MEEAAPRTGSAGNSAGKESTCNSGDPSSIPGSGRSPGEGHGHPLQYTCLENPMGSGAWQTTVHRVAKSQTRLKRQHVRKYKDFRGGSDGRESACDTGDLGSNPGSGRYPGEGHDNPVQYSCLENPLDRGAWRATVRGIPKNWT